MCAASVVAGHMNVLYGCDQIRAGLLPVNLDLGEKLRKPASSFHCIKGLKDQGSRDETVNQDSDPSQ